MFVPPVENVEGAHDSHAFIADEAYLPATQYAHFDDPDDATFPMSQAVQLLAEVPEYVPISHFVQAPVNPPL